MPPIQTQIAKITPPLLTDILPRKRLFSLFDRTMKKPVVWVSAPGGSGKTTLVSSYLKARKRPCIWYQVDEGDAEIATFFYYMGLAAKKANPRKKKPLPLLTPEYLAGLTTFTRHYFEQLFSNIKAPFTLVFDNYQDVSSEAFLHRTIGTSLSLLPKGINVVMVSRNDPPAEFARLRANGVMGFIGWEDIQFTLEEMREVLRERGDGKISAEVVRQLHEKTEGWIAGLVLYMERAKTEGLDTDAFEKIARGGIFDYFATEVFRKADAAMQDFLLETAFLPQVAPSIAEKLTGCKDAGQTLKRLSQDHFFTTRHAGNDAVFQYHPLFREFLLAKANALWSADEVHNVRRSAALLLEEAGRTEDAVDLFLRAESWTEVGRVIGLKAQAMLSQGRSEVVRSWLDRLPKEIVSQSPRLLYWRGLCVIPFNPPESRKNFEKALELFRKEKDSAGMFMSWAGAIDVAIYSDEYAYLDSLVNMFDGFVKEGLTSPSPEIDARIGMSMFNALSFRQPNHPDIDKWEERAFGLLHKKNLDVNLQVQLGFYMHIYHLYMGNFPRARLIMTTIEGALSNNVSDLMFIMFKHQGYLYDYFTGNYDTTPEKIAQALDRADNSGIHVSTYQLNCIKASMALCGGAIAGAAQTMKELSAGESAARPFDRGYYHFLRAWEAVLQGRTADAVQHAQLA
ncbi:MAG: hypothetical protein LUO89_01250, partial [Methanothrix sp.]|nr:hypothetical protein [Methanothrix sp.]